MSAAPIKLLGLGNPLLDISAVVPDSYLETYGLKAGNAILAEEKHLPMYQEMVEKFKVDFIAGGATQNSIRVAQWMLGSAHPQSAYIGCIGDDAFGARLKSVAEKDGMKTYYRVDKTKPTGTCACCIVSNGERSLVANLSAANEYKKEDHFDTPEIQALVQQAEVFYSAGFFLTVSPPTMVAVGKHACDANKTFCINLSAPFLVQFFGEPLAQVVHYADYVFGNETEAEALGVAKEWGTDLSEIALKLSALPKSNGKPRTVVFTQGSKATIVARNGEVQQFAVTPLPADKIVDTNGAGDSFVGGFLAQLVNGKSLKECVEAGHWAAALILQHNGCTFPAVCEYKA